MKALLSLAPLALALPAAAQDHSMHMPGMAMPAKPAAKPRPQPRMTPKPQRKPAPRARPQVAPVDPHAGHDMRATPAMEPPAATPDPHAGHDMRAMPAMESPAATPDPHAGNDMRGMPAMEPPAATPDPHAGHDMSATTAESPTGTDLPAGNAPAPAPPRARAADRYWDAGAMAAAEAAMRNAHGGMVYSRTLFDLLEYQAGAGSDGYRWDGEVSIGGDHDRFLLKSEGRGAFAGDIDHAEIQAFYGRALDPYWNLRAGVRQDLGPGPRATWAALAVEGVAPYWLDLEATLFLSTGGDLLGRVEGHYDQRLTQDLVLQPRAELNFAAQDMPGTRAGLSEVELGLRLRYERVREFAPYLGASWDRKLGGARRRGEGAGGLRFVAGIRTWF